MAITEEERHRLYQRLEEVLGAQEATTLMEHLPPVGWADVATKRDLDTVEHVLRTELGAVERTLQADVAAVRTHLGADVAAVRTELGADVAAVRTDLGAMEARLTAATMRIVLTSVFAANATLAALAFGAARLA